MATNTSELSPLACTPRSASIVTNENVGPLLSANRPLSRHGNAPTAREKAQLHVVASSKSNGFLLGATARPTTTRPLLANQRTSLLGLANTSNRTSFASTLSFESLPEEDESNDASTRPSLKIHTNDIDGGVGTTSDSANTLANANRSRSMRERTLSNNSVISTTSSLESDTPRRRPRSTSRFSLPSMIASRHSTVGVEGFQPYNLSWSDSTSPIGSPLLRASSSLSRPAFEVLVDEEQLRKREERRWKIAEEFKDSEKTYLSTLEMINTLYVVPLRTATKTSRPEPSTRGSHSYFGTSSGVEHQDEYKGEKERIGADVAPEPVVDSRTVKLIFANFSDILNLSRLVFATLESRLAPGDRTCGEETLYIQHHPASSALSSSDSLPYVAASSPAIQSEGFPIRSGEVVENVASVGLSGSPPTFNVEDRNVQVSRFRLERSTSLPSTLAIRRQPSLPRRRTATQRNDARPLGFGAALLPILPYLKQYALFVSNFSASLSCLSSLESSTGASGQPLASLEDRLRWQTFTADETRRASSRGLGLSGLLLNIVQRVPRYRLMLQDLIRYTEQDHEDFASLKEAFALVDQVATHLEAQIHSHASSLELIQIQRAFIDLDFVLLEPGRRLIKWATVLKLDHRGNESNRTLFLFNDLLVCAENLTSVGVSWGLNYSATLLSHAAPQKPSWDPCTLRLDQRFALDCLNVFTVPDGLAKSSTSTPAVAPDKYLIDLVSPTKSFAVAFATLELKSEWISTLRQVIATHLQDSHTLQRSKPYEDTRTKPIPISNPARTRRVSFPSSSSFFRSTSPAVLPHPTHLGMIPATPISLLDISNDVEQIGQHQTGYFDYLGATIGSTTEETAAAPLASPSEVITIEDYSAPVWIPDSQASRCMRCFEVFGLWRRKHHCRLCGLVVCWRCSEKQFIIPSQSSQLVRACDTCYTSLMIRSSAVNPINAGGPIDDSAPSETMNSLVLQTRAFNDEDPSIPAIHLPSAIMVRSSVVPQLGGTVKMKKRLTKLLVRGGVNEAGKVEE